MNRYAQPPRTQRLRVWLGSCRAAALPPPSTGAWIIRLFSSAFQALVGLRLFRLGLKQSARPRALHVRLTARWLVEATHFPPTNAQPESFLNAVLLTEPYTYLHQESLQTSFNHTPRSLLAVFARSHAPGLSLAAAPRNSADPLAAPH